MSGYSDNFLDVEWDVFSLFKAIFWCSISISTRTSILYSLYVVSQKILKCLLGERVRLPAEEVPRHFGWVNAQPLISGVVSIFLGMIYKEFYKQFYAKMEHYHYGVYTAQYYFLFVSTLFHLLLRVLIEQFPESENVLPAVEEDRSTLYLFFLQVWNFSPIGFAVYDSLYFLWNDVGPGSAVNNFEHHNSWVSSVLVDISWYYGSLLVTFLHAFYLIIMLRDFVKLPAAGAQNKLVRLLSCFVLSQFLVYGLVYLASVFHLFMVRDSRIAALSHIFSFYSLENFKHFLRISVADDNLAVHVIGLREPLSNADFLNISSKQDPNIQGWFYPHSDYFDTSPFVVEAYNISCTQ